MYAKLYDEKKRFNCQHLYCYGKLTISVTCSNMVVKTSDDTLKTNFVNFYQLCKKKKN